MFRIMQQVYVFKRKVIHSMFWVQNGNKRSTQMGNQTSRKNFHILQFPLDVCFVSVMYLIIFLPAAVTSTAMTRLRAAADGASCQ
jgi:hypothetical protein